MKEIENNFKKDVLIAKDFEKDQFMIVSRNEIKKGSVARKTLIAEVKYREASNVL